MGRTGRPTQIISFYSFKGGAGRTMALANAAWIMASQGKKVLVMDWDLEAPGLHLYYGAYLPSAELSHDDGVLDMFSAFALAAGRQALTGTGIPENLRALHAEHANVERYGVRLGYEFPQGGELHYIGPGRVNDDDYADRLHRFDWATFQSSQDGREFLEALRTRMHDSDFDYILIDSRTGLSDSAGICTVTLPDTVVIALAMNRQAIRGAQQVAQRIRRSARPIRLHVLPMRIDSSEMIRLERCLAEAREALDPYLQTEGERDLAAYWGEVQVPYRAFFAYGEELAVMEEDPRQSYSVLAQYVKAVARITDQDVDGFRPIPRAARDSYHRMLDTLGHKARPLLEPQTLTVVSAPKDRLWAEWITEQLRPAGIVVVPPQPDGEPADSLPDTDYVLALLSPHLTRTRAGDMVSRLNSGALVSDNPREQQVIRVRIGTGRLATKYDWPGAVNLDCPSEGAAREMLLAQLGMRLDEAGQPSSTAGPRFPGRQPTVWNLPMPNAEFVGRDTQLAALQEKFAFAAASYTSPQVLYGMMGVGKHQIALEYAHRFASQYDLVWWIPAMDPDRITESFAELARSLNEAFGDARSSGDELRAVLEDLRRGRHTPRWLLVFDGAQDQASVKSFIPSGGMGHVLITSTSSQWSSEFTRHRVDVFTPEESLALLGRKLPAADDEELALLAERTGHLAIAEEAAAAELGRFPQSVGDYIARLDGGELPLREEVSAHGQRSFTRIYRQAYDALRANSPAAARLLELCSFLSPEGVGLDLIQSKAMLAVLGEVDPELERGTFVLQSRVKSLDDLAFAVLDYRSETLKVHRIVQDLVRGWLSDEERERLRAQVLSVLAARVPDDLDRHDLRYRPRFAELDRHVLTSKALESDDPKVHGWLVSQVYHRWTSGRWTAARELGESVLLRWRSVLGADATMVLRMEVQVAAACRMLGDYPEALRLSRHAVETERGRQRLGQEPELYTLMASRGYAAGLRACGEFRSAYEEDRRTFSGLNRLIGGAHNATLSASHNLAWSRFFLESAEAAVLQEQATHSQRSQVTPSDDYRAWVSYGTLGTFYREEGRLEPSERYLIQARDQLTTIEGENSLHTLHVLASLGMTWIRRGAVQYGLPLLNDTQTRLSGLWGARHPRTMSCRVAVAIGLHADGQSGEAADYIREELGRYVEMYGESHPFTGICRSNLALYLLDREGATQEDAAEAAEYAGKAVLQLRETFGRNHRYTLVARMNQNNCLAMSGEGTNFELAAEDEAIYEVCRQQSAWGERHPVTLTAMANLLSSRPEAHPELGAILVRRVLEYFPEGHPLARTLLAGPYRRTGADLEVHSD
ncbi:hypothetical protein DI272_32100 [Streptomyces sp. Act143]|uniref:FxSxx-COOH system tetratricopeptide repeat protein n=1 Tax=Streptomyces sp. Act143 TaxID=2200760 RepID=UPI000D679B04|nr:FxSxx-COOH system tetratricopeptide repeat protein [Streptomyces sp. Act143]PWI18271.1 hypothetical protein DI272_32100 [Streptomyces sp. Act143]